MMNIKELLNQKVDDESIIQKLYYNDLYLAQEMPETEEYFEILNSINKIRQNILKNEKVKKEFLKYNEKMNIKESIEAEHQFKLGFKTAIKILIEGL